MGSWGSMECESSGLLSYRPDVGVAERSWASSIRFQNVVTSDGGVLYVGPTGRFCSVRMAVVSLGPGSASYLVFRYGGNLYVIGSSEGLMRVSGEKLESMGVW